MAISFSSSKVVFPYSLPSLKTHKIPNKLKVMALKKGPTTNTTFYDLLSLTSKEVGNEEIKKAYRSMALKYHPDVCHDPQYAETFVLLNVAYKTLSDPVLRKEYDNKMRVREFGRDYEEGFGGGDLRGRWEEQVVELKRRSSFREAKKDGSWGCRLRAKNKQN